MAEYITKEQALENFENAYQSSEDSQDFRYYFESFIQCLPKADVIEIPKNATNGDMMKAMFPNYTVQINHICEDVYVYYDGTEEYTGTWFRFDLNWWNTPYRKE